MAGVCGGRRVPGVSADAPTSTTEPRFVTSRRFASLDLDRSIASKLLADSWARGGTRREHQGCRWAICITNGDPEGHAGTVGDAAGKAVNRKVHGSNPCSGASLSSDLITVSPLY